MGPEQPNFLHGWRKFLAHQDALAAAKEAVVEAVLVEQAAEVKFGAERDYEPEWVDARQARRTAVRTLLALEAGRDAGDKEEA